MNEQQHDLKEAILAALAALEIYESRSKASSRTFPTAKFSALRKTLESGLRAVEKGDALDRTAFSGLSKWVADWIPDLDDPLLNRLEQLESLVR